MKMLLCGFFANRLAIHPTDYVRIAFSDGEIKIEYPWHRTPSEELWGEEGLRCTPRLYLLRQVSAEVTSALGLRSDSER
jgi:hypothetical protein